MKKAVIILSALALFVVGCGQTFGQAKEKSLEGQYTGIASCELLLDITKFENKYSYKLQVNDSMYEGCINIAVYNDEKWVFLEGVPWVANVGMIEENTDIELENTPTSGLDLLWYDDKLEFQNYGNSMNYYVKLNCDDKYITFEKKPQEIEMDRFDIPAPLSLEHLKQFIDDTLVIYKETDNINLEIKVFNPCRDDKYNDIINYICVYVSDCCYSHSLIDYNPNPQMSLINLIETNIALRSIAGKQAVFIPFAYCGNADDDTIITYIVYYDHEIHIYNINLRGEEFENYKIADNLEEKFKDLPENFKKELIKHIEENAVKIISQ